MRRLVGSGDHVLAVVRESSDLWRLNDVRQKFRLIYGDLQNARTLENQIRDFQPDTMFHLAWKGGNSRKFLDDDSQILENIPGSLELVHMAKSAGCQVYVFLGSSLEYGRYNIPVRETDPLTPTNLYGLSKSSTLQLSAALCANYGIRFIGARLFWAYGPMDDELRMVPSVITRLIAGDRPSLTPGEQIWDFLYIDDVVSALVSLASTEEALGIFNIGSGVPVSVKEMVLTIRDHIGSGLEIGFGELPYAPNQVMHLQADVERLKSVTGWHPQVSLPEGIRRCVEWYRSREESNV